MKRLAGLLLLIACAAAVAAGLYISAAKRDFVDLDLLFWPRLHLRSGLVVVLAFIAGAVSGLAVGLLATGNGSPRRR